MTSRGSWLAATALLIAGVGVFALRSHGPTAALLGASVAAWLGMEYLAISRLALRVGRLKVTRELVQGGRPTPVLWADAPFTVRLTVTSPDDLTGVTLDDLRPTDLPAGDDFSTPLTLAAGVPAIIEYELTPSGPGVLRFEGIAARSGGEQGLFAARVVHRAAGEWYVLPRPGRVGSSVRTVKRQNALPPPGAHRLRRAGSGDELLDLRDYRPGDEPKMIAWKASARRDALITREIETDVPVRMVLLVDASESARAGVPGRTPAALLAALALGVARDALNARDPVGVAVVDDAGFRATAPSRGRRHEHDLARLLTGASARLNVADLTPDLALRHATNLARRVYPDLLEPARNSTPFGLFWRPIADSRKFWLVLAILAVTPILMAVARDATIETAATLAEVFAPDGWAWLLLLMMVLTPGVLAGLIWLTHGAWGLMPHTRRRVAGRKRLGLVLAHRAGGNAALIERVIHDDAELAARAAKFLADHRVRLPGAQALPLAPQSVAAALAAAMGRARDNELYALFLNGLRPEGITGLVDAIRAARARKHQIVVFAPSGKTEVTAGPVPSADDLLARFAAGNGDGPWRRELARAGASVIELGAGDVVGAVRLRLDQLRRGRRGARR